MWKCHSHQLYFTSISFNFTGTDRNNIVQTRDAIENYPLPFEEATLFTNAKIVWTPEDYEGASAEDLAINMATSGYYQ